MEFTEGSRAIATIDQIDSAYYEAGEDPFVAVGIVGSTRSPYSRRRSLYHHQISHRVVNLVEGAARQSRTEARRA